MVRRILLVLVCLAAPLLASAQTPHVESLYPQQAAIRSNHVGLVRLPLTADVIAGCRPDLSDLRVFQNGREVSYYVDAEGRAQDVPAAMHALDILEAERVERPVAGGPSRMVERYTIGLPSEASQRERWTLSIRGTQARFVRRVVVHAADEDGTLRRELARGTIFRLPRPRAERSELTIPSTDASRIVVEIEGDGFYVEPSFQLIGRAEPVDPQDLELPLEELSRSTRGAVTTIRLRRPRGFVPDRLVVETSARTFHVSMTVRDATGDGERIVGNQDIFRVADLPEAESLEIPVQTTNGEVLEVDVHAQDGEVPQFTLTGVVRQPALIFDHDFGAVLRFGGGRARKPDYGIASVLAGRALSGRDIPNAELGALERNPDFDPAPALAFAMHPGRPVDRRAYEHSQRLTVPSSPEGLIRVVPLPETLAAVDPDRNDLRIVDAENRQWAFIEGAPQVVGVERTLTGTPYEQPEDGYLDIAQPATRYEVPLPAAPLFVQYVTITPPAEYVDRDVTLLGVAEWTEEPYILATGRLVVRPDTRNQALELSVSSARLTSLELIISDGDDAPLRELNVELGYPTTPLYMPAPEGEYEILVGALDADRPVYELASARDLIFSVSAVDADLGELSDNAQYEPPSAYSRDLWKDILLWAVLILGVLALLVLTLRSAEHNPLKPEDDPEDGPEESAKSEEE